MGLIENTLGNILELGEYIVSVIGDYWEI